MGFFFFSPFPPNTLTPNSLAPEHSHPGNSRTILARQFSQQVPDSLSINRRAFILPFFSLSTSHRTFVLTLTSLSARDCLRFASLYTTLGKSSRTWICPGAPQKRCRRSRPKEFRWVKNAYAVYSPLQAIFLFSTICAEPHPGSTNTPKKLNPRSEPAYSFLTTPKRPRTRTDLAILFLEMPKRLVPGTNSPVLFLD